MDTPAGNPRRLVGLTVPERRFEVVPTNFGNHVLMANSWLSRHFSLANPRSENPTDLPALLRSVADQIEARGINPADILDVTISREATGDGPWWSATVYWPNPSAE